MTGQARSMGAADAILCCRFTASAAIQGMSEVVAYKNHNGKIIMTDNK